MQEPKIYNLMLQKKLITNNIIEHKQYVSAAIYYNKSTNKQIVNVSVNKLYDNSNK